jgi:hypothetical protein
MLADSVGRPPQQPNEQYNFGERAYGRPKRQIVQLGLLPDDAYPAEEQGDTNDWHDQPPEHRASRIIARECHHNPAVGHRRGHADAQCRQHGAALPGNSGKPRDAE